MRWKPVLSHPQQLFPTFSAIVVAAIAPSMPAQAQTAVAETPTEVPAATKAGDAAAIPVVKLVRTNKADDKASDKDAPTVIRAESMSGRPERIVNFDNGLEMEKGGTTLKADRGTYRNLEDEVEASGHLRMQRFGDCY